MSDLLDLSHPLNPSDLSDLTDPGDLPDLVSLLPVRRLAHERQLVRGVERGDLVALGERRVVEDSRQEIVEPPAERDYGLADVNELGGPAADAVAAEQPAAVAVEEHLEHALLVAADRAA